MTLPILHGTFNGCPCNVIYGDLSAGHYGGAGTPVIFYDCNTCITSVVNQDVSGCTDTLATNYNATATIDDGSCIYKWKCDLDAQGNPTGNPCYIDPTGTWNNQIDCDNFCSNTYKMIVIVSSYTWNRTHWYSWWD